MANNKSQHFVPQHYLRQFCIQETGKQICAIRINPFLFISKSPISGQCKQDNFYDKDGQLDNLFQKLESDLAPVILNVIETKKFDLNELAALQFLAVMLHLRTKKTIETAKVFRKHIAYEIIENAIRRGKLSQPPGRLTKDIIDFFGVAGALWNSNSLICWLEMKTLACKLLEADHSSYFVTSNNPIIVFNQLFSNIKHRSFAGFSRSGFQLLLPISPKFCLFFYDPKVYKVGFRRHDLVTLTNSDVELVNSLQVQSANECLYCHEPKSENVMKNLILKYSHLRVSIESSLRELPIKDSNDTFIHIKQLSVKLQHPWTFCNYRRYKNIGLDHRRDPAWSASIDKLMEDIKNNPGELFERIEEILDYHGLN